MVATKHAVRLCVLAWMLVAIGGAALFLAGYFWSVIKVEALNLLHVPGIGFLGWPVPRTVQVGLAWMWGLALTAAGCLVFRSARVSLWLAVGLLSAEAAGWIGFPYGVNLAQFGLASLGLIGPLAMGLIIRVILLVVVGSALRKVKATPVVGVPRDPPAGDVPALGNRSPWLAVHGSSTSWCAVGVLVAAVVTVAAAGVYFVGGTPSQASAVAITAGGNTTCALTADGSVSCWGENRSGHLGDRVWADHIVPVTLSALGSDVTAVDNRGDVVCAVTGTGVHCPAWDDQFTGDATAISVGAGHACLLTGSGGVRCWGWNADGQLGDGTMTERSEPVDVRGLTSGVTAIEAGDGFTCALTAARDVLCWGANGSGQLGDGSALGDRPTAQHRATPGQVAGLPPGITDLTVGGDHACALTASGAAMCWGEGYDGALGDPTLTATSLPVAVGGATTPFVALNAGEGRHTCALTATGAAWCWGANWSGQLGDGTTNSSATPVAVHGLAHPVASIAAGGGHTCAALTTGDVQCWGDNGDGQLGDRTETGSVTPVDVAGF